MLYIDLYVFGAKNFKNSTKNFIHLPRACAHAKNCKNVCKIHVVYQFICFGGKKYPATYKFKVTQIFTIFFKCLPLIFFHQKSFLYLLFVSKKVATLFLLRKFNFFTIVFYSKNR